MLSEIEALGNLPNPPEIAQKDVDVYVAVLKRGWSELLISG